MAVVSVKYGTLAIKVGLFFIFSYFLIAIFLDFNFCYSKLLHLPPLRFHCVGGCWVRAQDCCDFGIDTRQPDALTIRLDLIHSYISSPTDMPIT
jgi:hypothetical protein